MDSYASRKHLFFFSLNLDLVTDDGMLDLNSSERGTCSALLWIIGHCYFLRGERTSRVSAAGTGSVLGQDTGHDQQFGFLESERCVPHGYFGFGFRKSIRRFQCNPTDRESGKISTPRASNVVVEPVHVDEAFQQQSR
jgi:hypothetical protein